MTLSLPFTQKPWQNALPAPTQPYPTPRPFQITAFSHCNLIYWMSMAWRRLCAMLDLAIAQ
jgi:hypothetical protein